MKSARLCEDCALENKVFIFTQNGESNTNNCQRVLAARLETNMEKHLHLHRRTRFNSLICETKCGCFSLFAQHPSIKNVLDSRNEGVWRLSEHETAGKRADVTIKELWEKDKDKNYTTHTRTCRCLIFQHRGRRRCVIIEVTSEGDKMIISAESDAIWTWRRQRNGSVLIFRMWAL